MKEKGRKRRIFIFVLLLIIFLYLTFVLKIFKRDSLLELITLLEDYDGNFFIIFTIFSTILLVFFVPLSWISFFAAYFFGMLGFFAMIISGVISATISFSIARLFSKNIISIISNVYNRKERKYDIDYVSSLIEKHGISYIIYLRNTPVIPFTLTSYVAGTTKIKSYDHLIGSVLGLIPSLLLATYFYTSVMNITNDIKGVIIATILKGLQIFTVFYLFKRKFK